MTNRFSFYITMKCFYTAETGTVDTSGYSTSMLEPDSNNQRKNINIIEAKRSAIKFVKSSGSDLSRLPLWNVTRTHIEISPSWVYFADTIWWSIYVFQFANLSRSSFFSGLFFWVLENFIFYMKTSASNHVYVYEFTLDYRRQLTFYFYWSRYAARASRPNALSTKTTKRYLSNWSLTVNTDKPWNNMPTQC